MRTIATAAMIFAFGAATPAFAHSHHHHHKKHLNPADPSKGSVNGASSMGSGTGENKPTATGGQPGGPAGRQ